MLWRIAGCPRCPHWHGIHDLVGGSMDSQFPVHHPRHVGVRTPAKSLHQALQVLDGAVNVEYL